MSDYNKIAGFECLDTYLTFLRIEMCVSIEISVTIKH